MKLVTIILSILLFSTLSLAQTKKKKIIYKKYTELNFSGDTVQGQARTPELFYIFQRKRSEGHKVLRGPANFQYHVPWTQKDLLEGLPLE